MLVFHCRSSPFGLFDYPYFWSLRPGFHGVPYLVLGYLGVLSFTGVDYICTAEVSRGVCSVALFVSVSSGLCMHCITWVFRWELDDLLSSIMSPVFLFFA